jgi:hypothetical protein
VTLIIDIEFEPFPEMSIIVSLSDRSSDKVIPRPKGIVFLFLMGERSKLMRGALERLKSEMDWDRTRGVVFLRKRERRASSGAAIEFALCLPHEAASAKKMENMRRYDVIFLNIPQFLTSKFMKINAL